MRYAMAAAASLTAVALAAPAEAAAHRCTADAKVRAEQLLRLHYADGESPASIQNVGVGDKARVLAPVKALKGAGSFDVLELGGYVYRAEYRIRLIYARIPDACLLMGQEIIERSDPY